LISPPPPERTVYKRRSLIPLAAEPGAGPETAIEDDEVEQETEDREIERNDQVHEIGIENAPYEVWLRDNTCSAAVSGEVAEEFANADTSAPEMSLKQDEFLRIVILL